MLLLTSNTVSALDSMKFPIRCLVEMYLIYTSQRNYPQEVPEQDLSLLKKMDLIQIDATNKIQLSNTGQAFLLNYLKEDFDSDLKYTSGFEKFWKTFPASDKWDRFQESRKLRVNKKETFVQYLKALNNVTEEYLQKSIETEIANKKASSPLENPFKYMKASYNWLANEEYNNVSFEQQKIVSDDDLL
jgi:hypothetical protein